MTRLCAVCGTPLGPRVAILPTRPKPSAAHPRCVPIWHARRRRAAYGGVTKLPKHLRGDSQCP